MARKKGTRVKKAVKEILDKTTVDEKIIANINESMRRDDKKLSLLSIDFLKKEQSQTQLTVMKDAISLLTQEQMNILMLTEAKKDYIYKVISSPLAPEKKFSPNRIAIIFMGATFGLILGILLVLIIHSRKKSLSH